MNGTIKNYNKILEAFAQYSGLIKTVQLDEFANPEIITYSLESTIAEKFDAILQ